MVTRQRRLTKPRTPHLLPVVALDKGWTIEVDGVQEIVVSVKRVGEGPMYTVQTDREAHIWSAARKIDVVSTKSE